MFCFQCSVPNCWCGGVIRYFAHIGYNQDTSVSWLPPSPHPLNPSVLRASLKAYDARLRDTMTQAVHKGSAGGGEADLLRALVTIKEQGGGEAEGKVSRQLFREK